MLLDGTVVVRPGSNCSTTKLAALPGNLLELHRMRSSVERTEIMINLSNGYG